MFIVTILSTREKKKNKTKHKGGNYNDACPQEAYNYNRGIKYKDTFKMMC